MMTQSLQIIRNILYDAFSISISTFFKGLLKLVTDCKIEIFLLN